MAILGVLVVVVADNQYIDIAGIIMAGFGGELYRRSNKIDSEHMPRQKVTAVSGLPQYTSNVNRRLIAGCLLMLAAAMIGYMGTEGVFGYNEQYYLAVTLVVVGLGGWAGSILVSVIDEMFDE